MMQEPNATLATWLRTTRTEAGLTQAIEYAKNTHRDREYRKYVGSVKTLIKTQYAMAKHEIKL